MDPLVTIAACIYCDQLRENVAFTPVCRSHTAHEIIFDKRREEAEVTERYSGQHSENVQQRSPSLELDA